MEAVQVVVSRARTSPKPTPTPPINRQDGPREGLCWPVGGQQLPWLCHPLACPLWQSWCH